MSPYDVYKHMIIIIDQVNAILSNLISTDINQTKTENVQLLKSLIKTIFGPTFPQLLNKLVKFKIYQKFNY